ncbi:phage tail protein [Bacteroidota bacterium]
MKKTLLLLTIAATSLASYAQDGLGVGNTDPQEMLDVSGAVRIGETVISSPVNPGTIRWNSTDEQFEGWDGTQWVVFGAGGGGAVPKGTIVPFSGTVIPGGWLSCDGAAVSRTTYSDLFAVIGTAYGVGNGSTTFNLPDMRGRFARGVDAGSGNDPNAGTRTAINGGNSGNAVGSYQTDATALPNNGFLTNYTGSHNHGYSRVSRQTGFTTLDGVNFNAGGNAHYLNLVARNTSSAGDHSHTISTGGDSETRPNNVYVNYIINATGGTGGTGAQGPAGPAGVAGPTGPTGPLVSGTPGQTLYHNGSDWLAASNLYNTGTNVGVDGGTLSIDGDGAGGNPGYSLPAQDGTANQVLTTDGGGNATWGAAAGTPPGAVMQYTGTAAPAGWAICDGAEVSRTTNSDLFAVIGTAYGVGNGSTTFNLPDMRGRFARGVDAGTGNDPDAGTRTATNGGNSGNAVGSSQTDATARPNNSFGTNTSGGHNHNYSRVTRQTGFATLDGQNFNAGGNAHYLNLIPRVTTSSGNHSHTISTGGDSETRPTNVAFNYIIKL